MWGGSVGLCGDLYCTQYGCAKIVSTCGGPTWAKMWLVIPT